MKQLKKNTVLATNNNNKDRCLKFISLVTTKSISFLLNSLLFATPIKNWFSARLSLRQSACKRKGSERALVDTRDRRVRFL